MRNEELHGIIHSLSEKDRKRLLCDLTIEEGSLVENLFAVYVEMKTYDEAAEEYRWRHKVGKDASKKQLQNIRARLKLAVQTHLTTIGLVDNGSAIERSLYLAEMLFKCGLPDEAFRGLYNSIREHEMYSHPTHLLPCFYKLIWLHPLSTEGQKLISRKELVQRLDEAMTHLHQFHEAYLLNQEITELYVRNTIIKKEELQEQVRIYNKHKVFELAPDNLPYLVSAYILKSRVLLDQLLYNKHQLFESQRGLCAFMRKHERAQINGAAHINYLQEHINLALLAARASNAEILHWALEPLKTTHVQQKNIREVFSVQVRFVELLYLFYTEQFQEMRRQIADFDTELVNAITKIPQTISIGLRYGIMKCYLAIEEFNQVIRWHAELPIRPTVRADGFYIMHLIHVCALYEQARSRSDTHFMPTKDFLDAVRDFVSMHALSKEILPLEYHIHATLLRLTQKNDWTYHCKQFVSLADKMEILQQHGEHYILQFERMFSLQGWMKKQHQIIQKQIKK